MTKFKTLAVVLLTAFTLTAVLLNPLASAKEPCDGYLQHFRIDKELNQALKDLGYSTRSFLLRCGGPS